MKMTIKQTVLFIILIFLCGSLFYYIISEMVLGTGFSEKSPNDENQTITIMGYENLFTAKKHVGILVNSKTIIEYDHSASYSYLRNTNKNTTWNKETNEVLIEYQDVINDEKVEIYVNYSFKDDNWKIERKKQY